VDGELSELDAAYLTAHRRLCEACDAFAAGIEATAAVLRAEPLAQPSRPLVLARIRRPARQLTLRAATGVAAAAAVLSFVAGHVLQPSSHAPRRGAVAAPRFAPQRVPQPFSAFYSLSSATPTMTRAVSDNVAV